jgi:predicted transcriptional regulator
MATESTTSPPEDVNQAVREEWKAETDAFERVTQVARETHELTPSAELAERALVVKTTAIKHLKRLAEFGVVKRVSEVDSLYWKRNEFHAAMQRADDLATEYGTAELTDAVREMRGEIDQYRSTYGVDSPEELARTLDSENEDGWATLQEWRTTAKNLAIAKLALTFTEVQQRL